MGVAIGDLLEKKEIEFDYLFRKRVAMDALNVIYQFLAIIRGIDGKPLMDSKGRPTSHLSGLFYRNINLLEKGIKLVYVFDGKPFSLKEKTLEERKERKEEALKKYKQALEEGNLEEAKKYAQQGVYVDEYIIESSKELLSYMGIPFVVAPSEGEAQAAKMVEKGVSFAVGSQDYDSLLFGAKRVVRNITISGRRKIPGKNVFREIKPEMIVLEEVLSKLSITREKLIMLGILIGTDFNEKVPGIGPKKALSLVKRFDSLKEIYKYLNYTPSFDYEEVFEFFLNPPYRDVEIKDGKMNREKIVEFLCEEHDFSKDRVEKALERLEKAEEKKAQSSLSSWF